MGPVVALVMVLSAGTAGAAQLKVMKMGLGSGTVNSTTAGINCGGDCDESYASAVSVVLTPTEDPGSIFVRWEGDGTDGTDGMGNPIRTVVMSADRSVRAVFDLVTPIPTLTDFTPGGIQTYLTANPIVTTPARFLKALPPEFKRNWILMSRSESLQTGTARSPRLLLPSADARFVFTIGMTPHSSYPGSHPNAVEYMQWDAVDKNFRFHEVVLADIPDMGDLITFPDSSTTYTIPARMRGVGVDDAKCFKCHSTRNVNNGSAFPGTTGIPVGLVQWKNKPNWDTYDSWGGMMPFNRDRIYQGSVEAAAFRKLLNWWTWRGDAPVRGIIEQLELQPPGVPTGDVITRTVGGANDGHINFSFDASPPVLTEPPPSGSTASITSSYSFNGVAGSGTGTSVQRGGMYVTLHHSGSPTSGEGRAVQFFDLLGGQDGKLNQQRIADELINHRFATGSVPIDVRPIALAIFRGWIVRSGSTVISTTSGSSLSVDLGFFNSRNGMTINQIVDDTSARAKSIPRRKADNQKLNLDRTGDVYLSSGPGGAANGLVQEYGTATSFGIDASLSRIRQEVFRRYIDAGSGDSEGILGGIYVDREVYGATTEKLALFRYFLEPLGVSVDKWSMGVRGRSRTYTFADVFDTDYVPQLRTDLRDSLLSDPIPGLSDPDNGAQVIAAVNSTLSSLPPVNDVPTFTDVQRIFNKSCIECHGGLLYPPYRNYVDFTPTGHAFGPDDHLDFSEDENPPATAGLFRRLNRSYQQAVAYTTMDPATSYLFSRITATSEACPFGLMPCGGPALSSADIETIRRWIVGPPSRPATVGDPHIRTVDGVNYDFQAVGEFILLRDEFLEVQTRQTAVATDVPLGPNPHTGLTSCVSVNTAIAVRLGTDRITYQPHLSGQPDPSGLQLRINGILTEVPDRGIPLASGGRILRTIAPGGIQIEAPGGSVIVVTPGWWNHYQVWYLNVDMRNVRATRGLMGSIPRGSWLPALPDGTHLGPKPPNLQERYKDLYEAFGNAWRVDDTTSLFHYAKGTSTATFSIPSWPNGISNQVCIPPMQPNITNLPPLKPLPLAVAQEACSGVVDPDHRAHCVADVMATGEIGYATTYLLADEITRNTVPTAPDLAFPDPFPTNALVGPVNFAWNQAVDQEGDPIRYKLYIWPAGQIPNNNMAEPVLGSDQLSIQLQQGLAVLEWLGDDAQLEFAGDITGPWFAVTNAASPHYVLPKDQKQFYRLRLGENQWITKTVYDLEPGRAYHWKVIAEDGRGGTVESETRRFEVE